MRIKSFFLLSFLLAPLTGHGAQTLPFPTAVAENKLAPLSHTLDGVVEAVKKATISAQVSGRVTEVNFDIDDYVEKGSVLVRIRDKEYKARLNSAKAALKEAQAKYKDATLEFERVAGLYKDKIVSASTYDKAKAARKAAEARVSASEARITEAKEKLDNTVIKAPYSGIVTQRFIEPGETMNIGQKIMTGFSMSQLRVNVDVPQAYIKAVRKNQSATIYSLENSKQLLSATELTVFPFANPKSHTFRVRATLPQNSQDFFPGMLVKVAFQIDKQVRLMIPTSAIVNRSEVSAVYVVSDNRILQLRQVRVGKTFSDQTEIVSGLDAGETVAVDPVRAGVFLKQTIQQSATNSGAK